MMIRALLLTTALLASCSKERIEVSPGTAADYNQAELRAAVDKFVAAGRTGPAYAELAGRLFSLRDGMDHTVAREAELRLVVLALGPVEAVANRSMAEQVEVLALTVWPTLLSPPLAANEINLERDPSAALLQPRVGEGARSYLLRLCGGPLAGECKQIVPEYQGPIVAALAIRHAMERARNAVSGCITCDGDPAWHDAVRTWEQFDRAAHAWLPEAERLGRPDNWPIAGAAAVSGGEIDDPTTLWREAQINTLGEVVIGGQRFLGGDRIRALHDLRADYDTITLHLRPDHTIAQLKGVLADTWQSGASRAAIVARTPEYPWERQIYWLSPTGKVRVNLRASDSLQLLLHTIDHVAPRGAITRVD